MSVSSPIPLDYNISERDYNAIADAIHEHPHPFNLRPDAKIKVSLAEYGWIAHESSDDSWNVILRVSRRNGGPGFRIIHVEREDMEEYLYDKIDDDVIYRDESDWVKMMSYVKNNKSLRMPSHLGDAPWTAEDLIEILRDSAEVVRNE